MFCVGKRLRNVQLMKFYANAGLAEQHAPVLTVQDDYKGTVTRDLIKQNLETVNNLFYFVH